jgi:hypothetical protein
VFWITLTMQVPAAFVVQELPKGGAPPSDDVQAIDAPAAGTGGPDPSVAVVVNVKSCCVPTGLVADGEIDTRYAIHVFVAVGGVAYAGVPGCTVTVLPDNVTVIAPGVTITAPGTAELTVTEHVPDAVPVAQVSLTRVVGSLSPTASAVPSGTGMNPAPSPASCCTVIVNVCGTPVKFVASGLSSTRYCNQVFVDVSGTA